MTSVGADQIRDTFFDLLARYGVLAFLYEVIMTGFSALRYRSCFLETWKVWNNRNFERQTLRISSAGYCRSH